MITLAGRKILVTGGSGFIGSALVRALVAQGAKVRCLDDNSRGSPRRLTDVLEKIELVNGDIRDAAVVRSAVAGMETVCHLAYVNGTEFFYSKPDLILEVAVKGMMNVLDACLAENVRDLFLASSSEVYQNAAVIPTPEEVPLVVPDPLNPRFSYGGGKIISELLALNYGRKHFERVVIFRPHNVYGPNMGREHVIPQFALRLKDLVAKADPTSPIAFPIQGSGQETRAFIFIDDFTDALLRLITHGEHMNIYHIGRQEEVTVAEVARLAARAAGREIRLVPSSTLLGSAVRRCPDVTKLSGLGFVPKVSLEEGVDNTVKWYLHHG
jgi:nucleoside-diphosphate-sugar epimerase